MIRKMLKRENSARIRKNKKRMIKKYICSLH